MEVIDICNAMTMSNDFLGTTNAAAKYITHEHGIPGTVGQLKYWRRVGWGPTDVQYSPKRVGYHINEIERWVKTCRSDSRTQGA